jgi:hypothetical protein
MITLALTTITFTIILSSREIPGYRSHFINQHLIWTLLKMALVLVSRIIHISNIYFKISNPYDMGGNTGEYDLNLMMNKMNLNTSDKDSLSKFNTFHSDTISPTNNNSTFNLSDNPYMVSPNNYSTFGQYYLSNYYMNPE